jgi:NAD(P)H-dependent flavin oxidoreductase YrpB (nitropropane dioxygenase family)
VAMPRNGSATGHCEKELRQEFTQKYPSPSSPEEARLEKEIQEEVMKHEKILQQNAAAPEQHHLPAPLQPKHDRTQERGMDMGF